MVESFFEDRGDTFVAMGAEDECSGAGRIEAFIAIAFSESQYPQARTIALFGVRSFTQDLGDEGGGLDADVGGPALQALGRELGMVTVLLWHVLGDGGVASGLMAASMAGDALAFVETLNGGYRHAHIELPFDQVMRHRVIVALDFDVVIDMHACLFPFGVFIRVGR